MKNWNAADLKKLEKKGFRTNLNEQKKAVKVEKSSLEKSSIEKALFVLHYEEKVPQYVREYVFHPKRKFRFDWAIPELKIAIEYEGLFSEKSGHTTVTGYTKDCEKYNQAALLGWKVLRYTALNYKQLYRDIDELTQIQKR